MITTPLTTTRHYLPEHDLNWLHGLWQRTVNKRWYLSSIELQKKLAGTTLSLVAEQEGTPVGFCGVGYRGDGPAGILTLLIEPAYQRQGVGSALLKEIEATLRTCGIRQLNVGFGNDSNYFWPGIPADADSAWKFYSKLGWREDEPSFDLAQELGDYRTPPWVYSRLTKAGVLLRMAEPAFCEKIMAFEHLWFPAWAEFFSRAMAESEYGNILLALNTEENVVGAVLLRAQVQAVWNADLRSPFGTINVLGVAEDQQGKGVGIALAAMAMEILKERRCSKCYIQWTGLVDWYGKLGAEVWAEYRMGSKKLL